MPRRSGPSRRLLIGAGIVALLVAAAGCSGGGEPSGQGPSPTDTGPTPLAEMSTTELTVARSDFCAQVAPDAVASALGAAPMRADRWRNGERTRFADGLTDVAHEYGCRWRTRGGATASAWVFAPPITRREAVELSRDALQTEGCREASGVPRFGRPTVAVRCTAGDVSTVALHGLFGDAWLSCSVAEPVEAPRGKSVDGQPESASAGASASSSPSGSASGSAGASAGNLVDRAEQWCVDVALAAEA